MHNMERWSQCEGVGRRAGADVAGAIGLTDVQVERVYRDIEAKRRTTLSLHLPPLMVEEVPEIAKAMQSVQSR